MKGNAVKLRTLKDHLPTMGLAAGVILINFASIDFAMAETITTTESDIAVINIPQPKEGNLLMLRGLAGKGTASFRINSACRTMPVRFVAGDFSGEDVDVARTGSIRIVITNPEVMRDLLAGRDLVSDMVRVSSDPTDRAADLYLAQGLSADTGFVINPGRNLFADVLGARNTDVDCASLSTTLP
ncbi:hypothetical protein MUY35_09915 [Aliiroseovarius sp. S1339]|uniref:hypothetical protein n=1 Tax=Aliiroseovarius sp. S1339 TaxID=2936990 RepID=UPI0020BFDE50|nr:hypothetical protein [Aliiroseovarius sp. S1339]MCK8464164.1 hypothetical protein [Aliiroseovarius sp. S1339]